MVCFRPYGHRVAQFFVRFVTAPDNRLSELFPDARGVGVGPNRFADAVMLHWTEVNKGLTMSDCRVKTITLRKKTKFPQHEFITYDIVDASDPTVNPLPPVGMVMTERVNVPKKTDGSLHVFLFDESTTCLDGSDKDHYAFDRVLVFGVGGGASRLANSISLSSVTFDQPKPLTEVAALMCILNESDSQPDNIILKYQCYWWALMTFRMLVGAAATNWTEIDRTGAFDAREGPRWRAGTCVNTRIVNPVDIEREAANLAAAFAERLDDITKTAAVMAMVRARILAENAANARALDVGGTARRT